MVQIPNELAHLRMLATLSENTRHASEPELRKHAEDLRIIDTSLSALYQASTCHRKCHGGAHILEALAGRAYNLGGASYILISRAFYDEALNLVRSIGEISNLVLLSVVDKDSLGSWLSADRKTRLKDFSPAKVRCLLEAQGTAPMYFDKDWYSLLCDKYTHVSPRTRPNLHNDEGLPHVGGALQPAGVADSVSELATVLGCVAMVICKYFDFDDLFGELRTAVASNGGDVEPAS